MIAVRCSPLLATIALLAVSTFAAASDETLVRAKELYRSANYDEALVILDQVARESSGSERVEAAEYRLFCLIALDRRNDARVAIESMVSADPLYTLAADQASPRVRTMFKEVRQSLLPGIVQREYAAAKAAFDRQDPESATQFERVIALLNDPIVASNASFADLRTVSSGFRDLSKALAQRAAAAPPAVTPVVSAAPAAPAVAGTQPASNPSANERGAAAATPGPVVYREGDAEVIAPVTLRQVVPQWVIPSGTRPGAWQPEAVLEITIDENGDVAAATLRKQFHPTYDPQLIKAAMGWKYEPARKGGVPVRYVKLLAIRLGAN